VLAPTGECDSIIIEGKEVGAISRSRGGKWHKWKNGKHSVYIPPDERNGGHYIPYKPYY